MFKSISVNIQALYDTLRRVEYDINYKILSCDLKYQKYVECYRLIWHRS